MPASPFYITTPLYYVNDELHIGHATTTIYADALARFRRLDGDDVTFLTGSDEHGQKIFKAAQKANLTPKAFADQIVGKFRQLWDDLGIKFDQFIRTTEPFHERAVRSFFQRLKDRGLVYKGTYQALYCTDCEQSYSPSNLLDGKCPIHKTEPVKLDEENYFFKLSAFATILRWRLADPELSEAEARAAADSFSLPLPAQDPGVIVPSGRRNEILGKLREGLDDTSISRTAFDWGVRMPGDDAHVIWVWFDALINYVSMQLKAAVEAAPDDPDVPELGTLLTDPQYQRLWNTDGRGGNVVHHLIGKDILWHHSVVWWSMLHGVGIPLPHRVFAHGWWTIEGDKVSKTLGNVIRPAEFVAQVADGLQHVGDTAPDRNKCLAIGRDALRYYVLRYGPAKGDADFRREHFAAAYNNELAGELGNLLSRTLGMLDKYRAGTVPAPGEHIPTADGLREIAAGLCERLRSEIANFDFAGALDTVWELIRASNRFIDETKPFSLAKDPTQSGRLDTVMHALVQTLAVLSRVLSPVLPESCSEMRRQLGLSEAEPEGLDQSCQWLDSLVGSKTNRGTGLFPRLVLS